MSMFWLENPNILLNKNYITEFWPMHNFDLARKLNAITRLIVVMTILGYFFTKSPFIPVSAVISIVVLVMIYKSKSKHIEGYTNNDKLIPQEIKEVLKKEFTVPTKKNPLMNVLIDEYSENPNRNPAAPAYVEKINEEINENAKSQDARLFKNLGDNLAFQHSMRNFYSMPNTQIPNNQKDFANFCYGNMPSCKEGDELQCSKNNASFRTT